MHPGEARALRKKLGAKRHRADISMREEKSILQRLGEVTFMIQQRQRWYVVQREMAMGIGIGLGAAMKLGRDGRIWGNLNGAWITDDGVRHGQQAPCLYSEVQPQGYNGSHGWNQQFPVPGYMMDTVAESMEGGRFTGLNGWQPAPVDSPRGWEPSQISGTDVMMQKSPWAAKSDSMLERTVGRRGGQTASLPDLGPEPWGGGNRCYLG